MRIVHFSDIHIGCWPRSPGALLDKRILGALNHALRRRQRFRGDRLERALVQVRRLAPDWVFCTGDITTIGTPEEFAAAAEALKPFIDSVGGRFVYIPGNHDVYVSDSACRESLSEAFRALNGARWELADLPVELTVGGVRFILVNEGIPNSCVMSTGALDAPTEARLRAIFERPRGEGEKRVLIGHFPCRDVEGKRLGHRRRLAGDDLIHDALRAGQLDVSLCGHMHAAHKRPYTPTSAEFCAGSLTMQGMINVVDYLPETGRFQQFWVDVSEDRREPAFAPGELPAAAAH